MPVRRRPHDRLRHVAGRIGGTGIGLVSARQIVEQHGGTIAVASVEGLGSTFTVRLPLAPAAIAGTDTAPASGELSDAVDQEKDAALVR